MKEFKIKQFVQEAVSKPQPSCRQDTANPAGKIPAAHLSDDDRQQTQHHAKNRCHSDTSASGRYHKCTQNRSGYGQKPGARPG